MARYLVSKQLGNGADWRTAMSPLCLFELIKVKAKKLSKFHSLKLSVGQEQLSRDAGFSDFHELHVISIRRPNDYRLQYALLGNELEDALLDAYDSFSIEMDNIMAGAVAETNAYDFEIGDTEVSISVYDDSARILTQQISFTYAGRQDQDRMWHGSAFYLDAIVQFEWRGNRWALCDDGVVIYNSETDQDRDREAELDDLYAEYLLDTAGGN